ncbi:MAG: DUF4190 domain-containing protein [Planctomycetes bacterium]|nr:DUF4190 domain-containing protein [Planctomycetota bacterium]MCW8136054.1 DUF4190 domain-containing protein [Planctomycetota bacterium]
MQTPPDPGPPQGGPQPYAGPPQGGPQPYAQPPQEGPPQNPLGNVPQYWKDPPEFRPGIPPPPPPPPFAEYQPPKPTSGKAIAALCCGVGGLVLGFFCPIFGVACLVGLILGLFALAETGKNGTRGGRGLAIAGVATSVLAIGGAVAISVWVYQQSMAHEEEDEFAQQAELDKDLALIVQRVQEYYLANDNSLGAGGPAIALTKPEPPPREDRRGPPPVSPESDAVPDVVNGKVTGVLHIKHLVRPGELSYSYNLNRWSIEVTDHNKATVRANGRGGRVLREVNITDAGKGQYIEVRR